ncbi:hypothetical protein EDC04DRAFT_2572998 [Pisolithus marmoratus]|nr:hypothetical protein EDC04DRAFT_2572998 [Pisolithus marmoratus]
MESILTRCHDCILHACKSVSSVAFSSQEYIDQEIVWTESPGTCAVLLVQHCPACFGGNVFGQSLAEGGDIHVATDGNVHHQHRCSVGDCSAFYDPVHFISKSQVDTVG